MVKCPFWTTDTFSSVGLPFASTAVAGPPRSAGNASSSLAALAFGAALDSGAASALGLAEASAFGFLAALGFSSADLTLTSSSDFFTYLSAPSSFSSFSSGYSPAAS